MDRDVRKVYDFVISDVISSVREAFADEGIDEQVLMELKANWEKKLADAKTLGEGNNVQQGQQANSSRGDPSLSTPLMMSQRGRGNVSSNNHHLQASSSGLSNFPNPTISPPGGSTSSAVVSSTLSRFSNISQVDGNNDTSDEDDENDDDDHDDDADDAEEKDDEANDSPGEDEDPLNSEDDVSDDDPGELFETDNVVVCQFDKITRSRNKWKFHLKDGIMNLQGRDYVFQKATGDAEW